MESHFSIVVGEVVVPNPCSLVPSVPRLLHTQSLSGLEAEAESTGFRSSPSLLASQRGDALYPLTTEFVANPLIRKASLRA